MRKKDFMELAKDLNCFWRGFFSDEELKENVDCYWSDYKASQKVKEPIGCIKALLGLLDEEGNDPEAFGWAYRIRKGIAGKKVGAIIYCGTQESYSEWILLEVNPKDKADAKHVSDCAVDNWLNNEYYEDCTLYETFEDMWTGRPVEVITSCY